MTSSIFTKRYEVFRELLAQCRRDASVTQLVLAERLGRPQSFVSKYESGERRLDIIEFLEVAEALQFDPIDFIEKLTKEASK
ncbi:MAG: helix-turn-helix domain-containing protein [Desulfobacteraceae bacterium]|nr:helix-turn-helix domain-containing protein [Desulfobacteraceae bacterium]